MGPKIDDFFPMAVKRHRRHRKKVCLSSLSFTATAAKDREDKHTRITEILALTELLSPTGVSFARRTGRGPRPWDPPQGGGYYIDDPDPFWGPRKMNFKPVF